MPELRKDPVTNRWVIIATERGQRPHDFIRKEEEPRSGLSLCQLCPGHEDMTPNEIAVYREAGTAPNSSGWWCRVVPNKFPALEADGELGRAGIGMYDMMNGVGAHEVIIETPDHDEKIALMKVKQLEEVLWIYRDRFQDLKRDPRIRYILIFKNHGRAAGASLEHPHSQLIATPVLPKRVMEELEGSRQYYGFKERCIYCDIIRQEKSDSQRVVVENTHFIAFQAYASRFPYETWILPKRHDSSYSDVNKSQVMDLAQALKEVLLRMHHSLKDPPFNYVLHTAPLNNDCRNYYHWHLEIIPRLTNPAGFEWGTGMYINPMVPETAAQSLREIEIK